jgi:hypothetical protein
VSTLHDVADDAAGQTAPRRIGWQLGLTWIIGSVVVGTLAVIFTSDPPARMPFHSVASLPGGRTLAMLVLLAVLFVGFVVLVHQTRFATWVGRGPRGHLLWAVVVCVAGTAGAGYAATGTFLLEYAHGTQILLGYLFGGLSYALVAAMLARPRGLNVAAVVVAGVLVVVGLVLTDEGPYGANLVQATLEYLTYLISPAPMMFTGS